MRLVVFGLTVSSSWGNGHATLWRGLCAALARRGHQIVFFERDVPYYAAHRDLLDLPGGTLVLYRDWREVLPQARKHLAGVDVAIVTSYCPDGIDASELVLDSTAKLRLFYDLDTPVTLLRLEAGEPVGYIGPRGLRDFDLVLSYTGGRSIEGLRHRLGARRVAPLYGSVDPAVHKPVVQNAQYRCDLSYLGTYSKDRDSAVRALFAEPARHLPKRRFMLAGSMYGAGFPWQPNIFLVDHLPPADHSAFYCSSRLTLNVTRQAMADTGYCPSGRLFEATACGATVISDHWEGLECFFEPASEVLLARHTPDVIEALNRSPEELARIARAAQERTLAEHTADVRVGELERILEAARDRQADAAEVV